VTDLSNGVSFFLFERSCLGRFVLLLNQASLVNHFVRTATVKPSIFDSQTDRFQSPATEVDAFMAEEKNIFTAAKKEYVTLDMEFQGFVKYCPIEIAAARFSSEGTLLDSYNSLVLPRVKRVSKFVTEMTGITTAMIRSAPPVCQVIEEVRNFIGDSLIVGHAVGDNDIPVIEHFYLEYWRRKMKNPYVDTFYWARELFPELGKGHYNLKALAENFHIEAERYHRALDDCLTTSRLFQILKAQADRLDGKSRICLISAFEHRHDPKPDKVPSVSGTMSKRSGADENRTPIFNYKKLPFYAENREINGQMPLAIIKIRSRNGKGVAQLYLRLRGEAPRTVELLLSRSIVLERHEFMQCRVRWLSASDFNKLGQALKEDGCAIYRAGSGRLAVEQKRGKKVPRFESAGTDDSHRSSGGSPVEIIVRSSGYDVVFTDAEQGVPAAWLGKQAGAKRLDFSRFRFNGAGSIRPDEIARGLEHLQYTVVILDERHETAHE